MGKAIAFLVLVIAGFFMLRATGLLDGFADRGNLEERAKFWQDTVSRDAPQGTTKAAVEEFAAKHGLTLECFHTSQPRPVDNCFADDPQSKGGTSGHPVVVELHFAFHRDLLESFEAGTRVLK